MKKQSLTVLMLLFSLAGNAQNIFQKNYFYFGGSYGMYSSNAEDFEVIYDDNLYLKSFFGGFGYDNFSVIAKYKQFGTRGESKIKNIAAKGVAYWDQEFYVVGLRIFNNNPVYIDLCFVETRLTEKIGTKNPVLIELEGETKIRDRGFALTVGACLPIYPKTAFLTCDFDYLYINHRLEQDDGDAKILSLGGFSMNIGLIFGLEY